MEFTREHGKIMSRTRGFGVVLQNGKPGAVMVAVGPKPVSPPAGWRISAVYCLGKGVDVADLAGLGECGASSYVGAIVFDGP
jgi:hypothetical protein